MAISDRPPLRACSIAEARDRLPGLVHDVEAGVAVQITRRGKPVAVIVSMDDFLRLSGTSTDFAAAYGRFRESLDPDVLAGDDDPFANVRDPDPGREQSW